MKNFDKNNNTSQKFEIIIATFKLNIYLYNDLYV